MISQRRLFRTFCRTFLFIVPVVVCLSPLTMARQIADFTNDPAITSPSPSITDVFDYMIWNKTKFNEISGQDNGDANADGFVDVSDFNIWNNDKFTDDGSGTCDPATSVCVSDADYLARLTSPPYGWTTVGGTSPFTMTTSGANDSLFLNLPVGSILQTFTVVASNAATPGAFGTNFDTADFFTNSSGAFTVPTTEYFNGRQQWLAQEVAAPGGWDDANNGLIAEFPSGSLGSASIVYQLLTGVGTSPGPESTPTLTTYFAADVDGTAVGLMLPEPNSTVFLLPILVGFFAMRSRRPQSV